MKLTVKAGTMSLNLVVPSAANLKIEWFHVTKSQKSSGFITPFSKIEWFHGTTGTTSNAGPDSCPSVSFKLQIESDSK